MPSVAAIAELDRQLDRLATLSPSELRAEWPRVWGSVTPRWSPDLLRLGIGYKLREKVHGGLKPTTLRELRRISSAAAHPKLKPGTQLVRSWHGRTVSVIVTPDGFEFEGRAYASLTAIAKEVTGAGWSGPRFFGLKELARG